MRVALDGMGGDSAPAEIVKGAVEAVRRFEDAEIIVTGEPRVLERELAKHRYDAKRIRIYPASQVVAMDESPVRAIRAKPDSSSKVAVELVSRAEADAVVSAGNTGAIVAAATLSLKRLPGVKRAGIAASFPVRDRTCTLIDVGANVECTAEHLRQYAVMATVLSRILFGVENPLVGLVSIGEEGTKGNDLVRSSYELLGRSSLNFIGNIEGRDIFGGKCDVAVCDGFVGNVILKVSEGVSEVLFGLVNDLLSGRGREKKAAAIFDKVLAELRLRTDYSLYGGAPLLGVLGICIICHGRSDARAISNAVRTALELGKHRVNEGIVEAIASQNP